MHPTSIEEYNKRFAENQSVEGFGLETSSVLPCPFCAAPRWMVAKVIEVETTMQKEHHCGECGRAARAIVHRSPQGVSFEFVQTAGPEQPDWMPVKMRREDL